MAFNYSTSWVDSASATKDYFLFTSTSIFTSEDEAGSDRPATSVFDTRTSEPGGKVGKGSKGSKGAPATDVEKLPLKKFLVITAIVMILIVIIGSVTSWILKTYRDKIQKQWEKKIGKFLLWSFFLSLSAFLINGISMAIFVYNGHDINRDERAWLLCLGSIPYQIGRLIMEIFFILRIHFIFGKSAQKINKYIIISLVLCSFIAFILGIIAVLGTKSVLEFWPKFRPNLTDAPGMASRYLFAATVISSIVVIIVMYIYIKILYNVTISVDPKYTASSPSVTEISEKSNTTTTGMEIPDTSTTPNVGEKSDDDSFGAKMKLQRTQLQLVKCITKNTLLGMIGLLTTLVLNVRVLYVWIADASNDPTLWRSIATVDGAVNIWCMYLIFTWTARQYDILCFYPNKMLNRCCIWCTKKSILRRGNKIERELSVVIDT